MRSCIETHRIATAGVLLAVTLLLSAPARAEDDPPPATPEDLVDVRGHLGPLQSELAHHGKAPQDDGLEGALLVAWKGSFKRRIGRMRRRVKDLYGERLWVAERETGRVLGLDPEKWSPFVRNLAALHTELGTCESGYRKTKVDDRTAKRRWLRKHPGPEPIDRVPSRYELDEIDRLILEFRLQNRVVPPALWNAQRRVRARVAEEEARARAERRREYEEAKRQAWESIEQFAADTRADLLLVAGNLTQGMESIRALLATAQQVEEDRLVSLLRALPEDPKRAAEAEKLLATMRNSRSKAADFSGGRLPRYGAQIQQGWMMPRTKLLALIAKAPAEKVPAEDSE